MSVLYDLGGSVIRLEKVIYLKKQRSKTQWLILIVLEGGTTDLLYFENEKDRNAEYDKIVQAIKRYE